MHRFSIDFITRDPTSEEGADYRDYHNRGSDEHDVINAVKQQRDAFRGTPSPSDSGMESDNSPRQSEGSDSIAEALLSLDKQASRVTTQPPKPDTSDEKPPHSYIALISMAILSLPERKMLLCDIYQYIMEHFSYYNNEEKAWRNSIRHNLSLNECFIKNGRADNGKGNYWSIHPACEEDFAKGDFRRRQARRRARKSIKDCGGSDIPIPYRYNVGYVPMTASHIGFHPYGAAAAATSLMYSQQAASYPSITSQQTSPTQSLTSRSMQPLSQHGIVSSGYMPPQMTSSSSQNSPISHAAVAAAHRLFSEQTSAVYGTQPFSTNHLATGMQFQSW